MYDQAAWPELRTALTRAMNGDGAGLLALADSYYERDASGKYANLMFANAAVNCLDLPPAFAGPAEVTAQLSSFEQASPVFGDGFAWSGLNCAYWPRQGHRRPTPHRGEGRRPDPGRRHHPRPGDPLQVGPVPRRPALLRHPPHLRGRRPHRVRPRQRLHRHRDQHLPPRRHPATEGKALLIAPPEPAPDPGRDHSRNCVDLATLLLAPWCAGRCRLSSVGQSNALVMRRSRVRIPKAAPWEAPGSLA